MDNVKMTVKDKKLVIEVDLTQNFGLSSTGKSEIVASTHGFVDVPNTDMKLGLNVVKKEKKG
jgi:hypothetical protein